MNDAGKQHKRAWEYDAYNFWVKHNGTPEVRAKEDVENPTKMLRKYSKKHLKMNTASLGRKTGINSILSRIQLWMSLSIWNS